MAGSREERTTSKLEFSGGPFGAQSSRKMKTIGIENDFLMKHSQDPDMNCIPRLDKPAQAQLTLKSDDRIEFLLEIIAGKDKKINNLEESLIRKHTEERKETHTNSSVDNSSQTEPVLSLKPVPPKEGTPRKSKPMPHRLNRTVTLSQDKISCNLYKLTPLRDSGIQASPNDWTSRPLPPVKSDHVTYSTDPPKDTPKRFCTSRSEMSKESRRSVLRYLYSLSNDRVVEPAIKNPLPPIASTESLTSQ